MAEVSFSSFSASVGGWTSQKIYRETSIRRPKERNWFTGNVLGTSEEGSRSSLDGAGRPLSPKQKPTKSHTNHIFTRSILSSWLYIASAKIFFWLYCAGDTFWAIIYQTREWRRSRKIHLFSLGRRQNHFLSEWDSHFQLKAGRMERHIQIADDWKLRKWTVLEERRGEDFLSEWESFLYENHEQSNTLYFVIRRDWKMGERGK